LFELLGIRKEKGGLIPFNVVDDQGVCRSYYNDVPQVGNAWVNDTVDPYGLNNALPPDEKIPLELVYLYPRTADRRQLTFLNQLAEGASR
jgi:hypothetical protein